MSLRTLEVMISMRYRDGVYLDAHTNMSFLAELQAKDFATNRESPEAGLRDGQCFTLTERGRRYLEALETILVGVPPVLTEKQATRAVMRVR